MGDRPRSTYLNVLILLHTSVAAAARRESVIDTLELETESKKKKGGNKMPRIEGTELMGRNTGKFSLPVEDGGESYPLTCICSRVYPLKSSSLRQRIT